MSTGQEKAPMVQLKVELKVLMYSFTSNKCYPKQPLENTW